MDQRVFLRLGLVALLAASLAGCGRKGPLELPPNAPPVTPAQAADATPSRAAPLQDNPGLIQPPTKFADKSPSEKLDQAARNASPAINAPPAPPKKTFFLDPLL